MWSASWVSTGQNLPISPEQLSRRARQGHAFRQSGGSSWACRSGDIAGQLSQLLPQVVDKLTPRQGQLPQGGLARARAISGGLLGSLLNR